MEAIATIQHFAVDTAFITAIKRNSRALNTRILEEAHLKEFQETTPQEEAAELTEEDMPMV